MIPLLERMGWGREAEAGIIVGGEPLDPSRGSSPTCGKYLGQLGQEAQEEQIPQGRNARGEWPNVSNQQVKRGGSLACLSE